MRFSATCLSCSRSSSSVMWLLRGACLWRIVALGAGIAYGLAVLFAAGGTSNVSVVGADAVACGCVAFAASCNSGRSKVAKHSND